MKHLTERDLSALADGALKSENLWRAERHLEECEACRDALAELSARDAALGAALAHDPGEKYFATFADRVVGRIASAEAAGEADAPARGAAAAAGDMLRSPIRLPWWQSPRGLAVAGTVTAVVAGAGLVLMTSRLAERPLASRDLSPAARATGQAPMSSDGESRAAEEGRVAGPESDALRDRPATAPPAAAPEPVTSPAPGGASPSASLESDAAGRREAASTRMKQVPRGATGEQRAAPSAPVSGFSAPPRATDENATATEKLRELKRVALGPAGQKTKAAEMLSAPPPKPAHDAAADDRDAPALGAGKSQEKPAEAGPATVAAPVPDASLAKEARRDLGELRQEGARPVCGTVRDDAGRPLAGVNVTAVDAARTTTSGADGRFCLELPPGSHELQLLAVGFRPARLSTRDETQGGELAATLQAVAVLGTGGVAGSGSGADRATRALRVPPPRESASANALGLSSTPSSLSLGDAGLRDLSDSLRSVANEAARLQTRAAGSTGASGYEAAAVAWERLIPGVSVSSAEVEIRARVAECRFAAWQRSRDRRRTGRAVEALTSYISRAPAGERRDLAARWLDQTRSR